MREQVYLRVPMRSLKIALLSRWYAEEHRRTGGTGTVQELAEAVAALGHEVVVLSQSKSVTKLGPSQPGEFGALETWLSARERRRGWVVGLFDRLTKRSLGHRKTVSDSLDLRDFLARRGPFDVLWAQCEEPDGLVAAFAAKAAGVPAIPPILTQIYALRYCFGAPRLVFTEKRALGLAFRHASRIVANSELTAHYVPSYGGKEDALGEK